MSAADLVRYALAAAARGWHVFPLAPGDKVPLKGVSWKGQTTADPQVIRRLWGRRPYNIGIACGPSNLVVIDLDVPKPGEKPPPPWDRPGINEGADVLAALCEEVGQPLPFETFQVRTRRGGMHLYFAAPPGIVLGNTSGDKGNGLGWRIDTRAAGGYVVGPGSVVDLPDGAGTYQVLHNPAPAPLPAWLADRLRPAPPPRPAGPVVVPLRDGRRGAYLDSAVRSCLDRIAAAGEGERNTTLWGASAALGQLVAGGALDEAGTEALLLATAADVGLPAAEARRTIRSGFRRGALRPRKVPA
ncbi:bifunctional DNA primase/polymerase [Bailinhaonella thermotolerans]|uniref:bifunctional DNA primase/polymerase n=1 Tax=Bailinhaonella thermotolerans TaxID=1070861 RepID=UPI001F5B4647|nr:bifunctional DNA primase/polymerase [Bailinhaonella thermotolerans]